MECESKSAEVRHEFDHLCKFLGVIDGLVCVSDTEGRIMFANRAWSALGYRSDDLLDKRFADLVIMRSCDNDSAPKQISGEFNDAVYFECEVLSKNGERKMTRWKVTPCLVARSMMFIGQECASPSADYLHKSPLLRTVFNSSSDIIIVLDHNGIIKCWNKAAELYSCYPASKVIGKSLTNLVSGDQDALQRIMDGSPIEDSAVQLSIKSGDGRHRVLKMYVTRIPLDGLVFHILTGKDITHRIGLTSQFHQGNSYLMRNQDIEDMDFGDMKCINRYLFISRNLPTSLLRDLPLHKVSVIDVETKLTDTGNMDRLMDRIREATLRDKNILIYLDRIDFLVTQCGFTKFMNFVYEINDFVKAKDSILIVNINPQVLDQKEMELLKAEFLTYEKDKQFEPVDSESDEILKLLDENILHNRVTSISDISKMLHISRITARKKIIELVKLGYVEIRKKGRAKLVRLA
jgi:PAS domain S-box-containing protein